MVSRYVGITLASLLIVNPSFARTPCYMTDETRTVVEGTIDRIVNVRFITRDSVEDSRVCTATVHTVITGKQTIGVGRYRFFPDTTQKDACEKALENAKINAVQKRLPENLTSVRTQKCDTRTKDGGRNRIIDDLGALPWNQPKWIGDR